MKYRIRSTDTTLILLNLVWHKNYIQAPAEMIFFFFKQGADKQKRRKVLAS